MESRERQVWIQASLTWWRSFVVEQKTRVSLPGFKVP